MTDTKSMPFARNLKIIMHHNPADPELSQSTGSVLKVDGNWRYIKWDNGVKTWHRVEQLKEKANRAVEVKTRMEPRKKAEVPAKATKPRPARKAPSKGPEGLRELLSLSEADTKAWTD